MDTTDCSVRQVAKGNLNRVWVSGDEHCGIFPLPTLHPSPAAVVVCVGEVLGRGGGSSSYHLDTIAVCIVQLQTEGLDP